MLEPHDPTPLATADWSKNAHLTQGENIHRLSEVHHISPQECELVNQETKFKNCKPHHQRVEALDLEGHCHELNFCISPLPPKSMYVET